MGQKIELTETLKVKKLGIMDNPSKKKYWIVVCTTIHSLTCCECSNIVILMHVGFHMICMGC